VRLFERRGPEPDEPDDEAPGWDSITDAFQTAYPDQKPVHVAPTVQPPFAGGILNGISAYRGREHFHFVTYGLTDLFFKTDPDDPDVSGWGYELTLTTHTADRPHPWAWEVLLHVARTTVELGTVYRPGARFLTGKVPDAASHLTGFALQRDPVVEPHAFPFGRFEFLQLVGITEAERTQMSASGTREVLARLMTIDPLGRTDPARDSLV
jgi:hypothetical protein